MNFLRSTQVLLCALAVLVPAVARTRPQAGAASSVSDLVHRIQEGKAALAFAGRGKLSLEERSGRPYPLDAHPLPPDDG